MVLLSWNLAGRVRRLPEQADRVLGVDADLIAIQELTPNTLPRWREVLKDAGYLGIEHGLVDPQSGRQRPLVVLTAARRPLTRIAVPDVPWPERVLAVKTSEHAEVVNVHSPISPKPDLAKVRTHEAVHRHLARAAEHPRIVCGDLNTPRKEHPSGEVWTFARDQWGRLRPDRGERWDQAELSLLRGLEPYGIRDGFRLRHGHDRGELSWEWPRWKGGYRLDHLLVSGECSVDDVEYLHAWRTDGLSDHSPLLARIELAHPGGYQSPPTSAASPACRPDPEPLASGIRKAVEPG
jgi:endonuclease/exonuclease/phosphatase family metal-dependent hydrolase